ncbi:LCP family protein [Parafrankia sp. FMc6]|uniref:LCP family protein n=1 Tax=Parafrankia soli TaxID=2599596 RepID=UPI0034D408AD
MTWPPNSGDPDGRDPRDRRRPPPGAGSGRPGYPGQGQGRPPVPGRPPQERPARDRRDRPVQGRPVQGRPARDRPAAGEENWPAGAWPRHEPRSAPAPIPPTRRLPPPGATDGGRTWPAPNDGPGGYRAPVGPGPGYGGPRGPYDTPGEDLPAEEPRRPVSGVRRTVTLVAAIVSVAVLVVATSGWAVLRHYDGKVNHIELTFSDSAARPSAAGGGTQNILLVGSDTRAGTGGEFGQTEGQRSDTTILAHLDADGSTTLVSFPRDLWVQIPGYTGSDGTQHDAQKSKLNAAFAYGGPSLLVRTIETLTNIRIDHYLEIDFLGFQAMTDALGGVTVCVKELTPELKAQGFDNLNDRYSGWHGQVGNNTLTGEQALAFVRQRYGLPGSDLDRIHRQQQFLGAVFREVASTGTLLNPRKLLDVVDAATSALTLDDHTSLTDLRLLAVRMQGISTGGVTFATVPATPSQAGGQSVLVAKTDELTTLLAGIGGSPPQAAGPPALDPAGSPSGSTAASMASADSVGATAVSGAVPASGTGHGSVVTADLRATGGRPAGGAVTLAQATPEPSGGVGCTY